MWFTNRLDGVLVDKFGRLNAWSTGIALEFALFFGTELRLDAFFGVDETESCHSQVCSALDWDEFGVDIDHIGIEESVSNMVICVIIPVH